MIDATTGAPIEIDQNEATINWAGDLSAQAELSNWEPQTAQTELADASGEYRAPYFGPGWEESAGDPKPKFHRLYYTMRRFGQWTPDTYSGVHAFVPWSMSDAGAHNGYQEPWGIDLTNDVDVAQGARVPWDYALSAPRQTTGYRV